jgi:hypothetical protein
MVLSAEPIIYGLIFIAGLVLVELIAKTSTKEHLVHTIRAINQTVLE